MKVFILATALLVTLVGGADQQFSAADLNYEDVVGGISGSATTTRYWDCCKPTCSWQGNIHFKSPPVNSCSKDGRTVLRDANIKSGCGGGGNPGDAYICNNYASTMINQNLAYGFAATAFIAAADPEKCCACFELTFQRTPYNKQVGGKKMVVQVINTGTAKGVNHFDLHMPGGGVGYYTEGCMKQWNTTIDGWGDRYGGVHTEQECNRLPQPLVEGCKFRFHFFGDVSNPPADFKEVTCPAALTRATGCTYRGR